MTSPTIRAPRYFRNRLNEAPKDVAFGLAWVLDHADTQEKQDAGRQGAEFKTDVLWSQLDALHSAYVDPGAHSARRLAAGRGAGRHAERPGVMIAGRRHPVLPRGVRVHRDRVRDAWVLLAPERAITLDPIGHAILTEIDGTAHLGRDRRGAAAELRRPAEQIARTAPGSCGPSRTAAFWRFSR